jgi:hypothetical protein
MTAPRASFLGRNGATRMTVIRRMRIPGMLIPGMRMSTIRIHGMRILAALPVIACAMLFAAAPARAQAADDREAVRQAVLDYVEGFYAGDTTRLARSVWPQVRKYGFHRAPADSAYRGMAMAWPQGFSSYAEGVRGGRYPTPANAPREIEIFDVQDQTASAKLTAYWGTDYLLLARIDGRWMITHVLWQSPEPGS